eukprot:2209796-Pyramimonas_sp.AAC.1
MAQFRGKRCWLRRSAADVGLTGALSASHDVSGAMRSVLEGPERLPPAGVSGLYGRGCALEACAIEPHVFYVVHACV